jgi:hypothetical protein
MARVYRYVGPDEIRQRVQGSDSGVRIGSVHDLASWLQSTNQQRGRDGLYAATFVIDEQGELRVADRGSEHVACSGGHPVLSAGEMFFRVTGDEIEVEEVTNQSTGFCPEPESWPAIAKALDQVGIRHPSRFTQELLFRRCTACGERNLVKDQWFVCAICGAELPVAWNFGK